MINTQPTLENDVVILYPLQEGDFDALYAAASDPRIWEQHPNKDRWQKDVFQGFFRGAMDSKGAFKIVSKTTGQVIGSTRFYDHNAEHKSIFIGYTFYTTQHWGRGINLAVKAMMLGYIFQYVDTVQFHIGVENIRSQIAIGRLGAIKIDEQSVAYVGEVSKKNFVYEIGRVQWQAQQGR